MELVTIFVRTLVDSILGTAFATDFVEKYLSFAYFCYLPLAIFYFALPPGLVSNRPFLICDVSLYLCFGWEVSLLNFISFLDSSLFLMIEHSLVRISIPLS